MEARIFDGFSPEEVAAFQTMLARLEETAAGLGEERG
jgi:hypothetical protein